MVGTVVDSRLDTEHRVAAEDTALRSLLDTFVDRGNELLRDCTAGHGVDKLVGLLCVCIHRLELDFTMAVLTLTAGLLDILGLDIHRLGEGLLVCNLRCADICLDIVLAEQTVDNDLEVQLAHSGDDGLTGLRVGRRVEGRILLRELLQRVNHLGLACLGLRLDCDVDNRLRNLQGLEDDRMLLVADRITGRSCLEADRSGDIAGEHLLELHSLVCVHLQNTTHALLLLLRGVEDVGTGVQRARVDAEECETADERVGNNLECECGERLLIGSLALVFLAVQRPALDSRDVQRGGHVLDDSVKELLDALVEVCGSAADRNSVVLAGALAEHSLQLIDRRLLALEVLLHELLVEVANLLHHLLVPLIRLVLQLFRNVGDRDVVALVAVVDVSLHLHEVDDALEIVLLADRQLNADRVLAETMLNLVDRHEEVRAHDIHLVDECDTRNAVGIRLSPDVLRLGLNTALCVEDTDSAVQDAERSLNLDCEIDVSGRIDDVDAVFLRTRLDLISLLQGPMAGRRGRRDRDAALSLLLHVVHRGGTFVGLTDLVVDACVVEDALGQCRFSGIDMRHDSDISGPLERVLTFFTCSH